MITKTGNDTRYNEAVFDTSALEPGFYHVGVHLEVTGLPPSSGMSLTLQPTGHPPVSVAATHVKPENASASGLIYLEAGASLPFSIGPYGAIGSATPTWTAHFYLYRATDVS